MVRVNSQIGKQGITEGTFEFLENAFRKTTSVKIKVLKAAAPNKVKVKEMGEQIVERLGPKYTCRVIGFTIFLKKWRKAKR